MPTNVNGTGYRRHVDFRAMLVSIVITNYNYGAYLAEAIDSALDQTYPHVEVIVVDDGSNDGSLGIIESYGDRIINLRRNRGGHCAACNAGFARSRGDVVIFLDADDALLRGAAAMHVERLSDGRAVKSCGYMLVIDDAGHPTGRRAPRQLPDSGDYRDETLARGIDTFEVSFTSAHAWPRHFLTRVMPLPEDGPLGVDGYLTAVDRLFGPLEFIHEPLVRYRRHGANRGPARMTLDTAYMSSRLEKKSCRIRYAEAWVERLGYQVNTREFRRLRDWRLALMQHVLVLLGHRHRPLGFMEFVTSPFQRHRPSTVTSIVVALGMAAVRWAPQPVALRLSRALLVGARSRRATYHSSEIRGSERRSVQTTGTP